MHITSFLNDPFSVWFWLIWAVFLVWQNYAFTYVSRARNSASLKSHVAAALQSNGVWFLQTLFVFGAFKSILEGKFGIKWTAFAVLYYTAFTMTGSIYAHYRRLKKESGKTAVGANEKYAQIPVAQWAKVQEILATYDETRGLAQEAHLCAVGAVPDSGIAATKIAGQVVTTGLPEKV
jgi:hypothetical protein